MDMSPEPEHVSETGVVADPFAMSPSGLSPCGPSGHTHLRYTNFEAQLFAIGPGASPEQAERALEARMSDIRRRMEEIGQVGTQLVREEKEVADSLQAVREAKAEGEISDELRQKLIDIEHEYNEVAKESARAFLLPKQRVPSHESAQGSPYVPEAKAIRRSISPSKFESTSTASPTKFSIPNRKLRNQAANRVHDIEFAAEISTSLISQVRNLQALLSGKDDELRSVKTERARLEVETEALQGRVKNLDESETRYKDENWSLETQVQGLLAAQKDAVDREKKLKQSLNALQADKNATQKELDETKVHLAKQEEKHLAIIKNLELELSTVRRDSALLETEKEKMQRKVGDLTSQNQELARAFAVQRGRQLERDSGLGPSDEDFQTTDDRATPEQSPPPSPMKAGTPRHSMLETETLKTSLQHAQRTIQGLRTNVHREKTEKLELKRMLQEARDELEKARAEPGVPVPKRSNKRVDSREFRRPGRLGHSRTTRTELLMEDYDWEDEAASPTTAVSGALSSFASASWHPFRDAVPTLETSSSEQFETANETSDAAFETAHETEAFHTGAEELSDDDTATETEETPSRGFTRGGRPSALPLKEPVRKYSYQSTASTSNDEDDSDLPDLRTPTATRSMRVRASRTSLSSRRSRQMSEEPVVRSSSPSFAGSSACNTPQRNTQSLFAELYDLGSSDVESNERDTPGSRRSIRSITPGSTARLRTLPSVPAVPVLPPTTVVDSGTMTEPVHVQPVCDRLTAGGGWSADLSVSTQSAVRPPTSDALTTTLRAERSRGTGEDMPRPVSRHCHSAAGAQHDPGMEEKLVQSPSPPTSPPKLGDLLPPHGLRPKLSLSFIRSESVEPQPGPEAARALAPRPVFAGSPITAEPIELSAAPVAQHDVNAVAEPKLVPPQLALSDLISEHVEPVEEPETTPPPLSLSRLVSQDIEPVVEPEVVPPPPRPFLSVASIRAKHVEPSAEPEIFPPPGLLVMSRILAEHVEPVDQPTRALGADEMAAPAATLTLAPILSEHVEPVAEPEPAVAEPFALAFAPLAMEDVEPVEVATEPTAPAVNPKTLTFSPIVEHVEPHSRPATPVPSAVQLSFSAISGEQVEPQPEPEVHFVPSPVPPLCIAAVHNQDEVEPTAKPEASRPVLSLSASIETQEVEPEMQVEAKAPAHLLSFSNIFDSEPVEPRSPKRNAFIIPRDAEIDRPRVLPPVNFGSWFGPDRATAPRQADEPCIAGDETRSLRRRAVDTTERGAQTALTSDGIDQIINAKTRPLELATAHGTTHSPNSASSTGTPSTVRIHRSHSRGSSFESVSRAKGKTADAATDPPRPSSATSTKNSFHDRPPPLPHNHRQVIEAARTGSSASNHGLMGPPPRPGSAVRAPNSGAFRPRTPHDGRPASPASTSGHTRRTGRGGDYGTADVHSPERFGARSRKSSMSSFASEIDTRFNMFPHAGLEGSAFGPATDPRMIQAITQTMIGEHLWKYTRKPGRGELSGNRHRRYFWVHPYTRTLYWSDRDPSGAERSELRAKSVPIEAVRVVTDDNPMPPGLHRKSLVIVAPGRTIKFTATTGQRHEIWFNALSYLLLRSADEGQTDAAEIAGHITREDVAEFNPQAGKRPTRSTGAPSLSSYNSRGTRYESPALGMSMNVPTLTASKKQPGTLRGSGGGTLSRISGYWKDARFGSMRSRTGLSLQAHQIYEASQVHDSAEDVREMIEQQDREANRLENVRACCDGKHDVGTISHSPRRGGRQAQSQGHTAPSRSSTAPPATAVRSRA